MKQLTKIIIASAIIGFSLIEQSFAGQHLVNSYKVGQSLTNIKKEHKSFWKLNQKTCINNLANSFFNIGEKYNYITLQNKKFAKSSLLNIFKKENIVCEISEGQLSQNKPLPVTILVYKNDKLILASKGFAITNPTIANEYLKQLKTVFGTPQRKGKDSLQYWTKDKKHIIYGYSSDSANSLIMSTFIPTKYLKTIIEKVNTSTDPDLAILNKTFQVNKLTSSNVYGNTTWETSLKGTKKVYINYCKETLVNIIPISSKTHSHNFDDRTFSDSKNFQCRMNKEGQILSFYKHKLVAVSFAVPLIIKANGKIKKELIKTFGTPKNTAEYSNYGYGASNLIEWAYQNKKIIVGNIHTSFSMYSPIVITILNNSFIKQINKGEFKRVAPQLPNIK